MKEEEKERRSKRIGISWKRRSCRRKRGVRRNRKRK